MGGTVVIIAVLVIAPLFICLSGAAAAAAIGHFLNRDRTGSRAG